MFEFLRRLGRFLNRMDAKAATSLLVSAVLLFFVGLMFFFGQRWLHLDESGALSEMMIRAADSPWAIPAVISVFVLLALTGFPQILLITATILTFGPLNGAVYAWLATMISAIFTFWLGHMFGGVWVRRFGGERIQSLIDFLGRHGVLASALVRVVPSAPFIVVNAAAGAAHIPLWKYAVGTGLGIVPKIGFVATLGALTPEQADLGRGIDGLVEFFTRRDPMALAVMAGVIGAWLGFLVLVRWLFVRLRQPRDGF